MLRILWRQVCVNTNSSLIFYLQWTCFWTLAGMTLPQLRIPDLRSITGCHAECHSDPLCLRRHVIRYTTTRWDANSQLIKSVYFTQFFTYGNKVRLCASLILPWRSTLRKCKMHPKRLCTIVYTVEKDRFEHASKMGSLLFAWCSLQGIQKSNNLFDWTIHKALLFSNVPPFFSARLLPLRILSAAS